MVKHEELEAGDKIRLLGELEHLRFHNRRSANSTEEAEDKVFYSTMAERCKILRRRLQKEWFPDVDEKDWCLVKSSASAKQIAYELTLQPEDAQELDDLCDEQLTKALGINMSGCQVCREDKGEKV